jgi:hypothetical protein
MLGGIDAGIDRPGNRFTGSVLQYVPVPLPRNYLEGIDFLKYEVENKYWSFLFGNWKFGSWWYYYIVSTCVKTPIATLLGAFLGAVSFFISWLKGSVTEDIRNMLICMSVPAMTCFIAVSSQGGFNHHHRYVLMIYPMLFAFVSVLGTRIISFPLKWKSGLLVFLFATLILESFASAPHYLSFFNILSGGSSRGWKVLGFSNVDWGQDLMAVNDWIEEHPKARPLIVELDYFDFGGELFDIRRRRAPKMSADSSIDQVRTSETQWWIVNVKKLYDLPGRDGLQYLQQIEPIERIANSYHVYRIDPLSSTPESQELHRP